MRQARERVLDIIVDGVQFPRQPAHNRVAVEVQHHYATEKYPGSFVRVLEKYIGGARSRASEEDEEE